MRAIVYIILIFNIALAVALLFYLLNLGPAWIPMIFE
jgi:uncharacterized protein involved in cysteine biosynthesis